ncbi:MAG: family transporter [Sphingomonas bacterium]|nr:family transporter [Sphingomonas bacterium]
MDSVTEAMVEDEAPIGAPSPALPAPPGLEPGAYADGSNAAYHRDRLLASLTLIMGLGLVIALPFALRAGAEFFLPVTAALVIAVALVPLLEWLERRRVPSGLSAFLCLIVFLGIANVAVAAIVVPASNWVALLPDRIGRIRTTVRPLVEVYSSLNKSINEMANSIALSKAAHAHTVTLEAPSSLLSLLTSSAPFALIQFLFAMLVIFFFLAGWSSMRRQTITRRSSFGSAMALARVIQEVVDATSSYIATITLINLCLGAIVAAGVAYLGLPTPLMWGGLVALLNYVPYLGPIAAVVLLGLGGLMTFADPWSAAMPAVIFVCLHLVEANAITPMIVGRKLTLSPLVILVALSFWGWVWGTTGAVLAVPLLIIFRTVLDAAGRPDIAGFLFEYGTLASGRRKDVDSAPPLA